MKHIQLGTTDLMVSRICFGCWQLSPAFWGDVDIETWRDAVKAGVEAGVNFFDTADAYGNGYAETELGRVMQESGLRDKIVLATKFYWNFEADPRHPDTRHDRIIEACERSLKRLQTDHIDLYQIHSWDALTRPDEVAAALLRLQREGKIRWIGVSNLNPEQMRMYGRYFTIASLQPSYSLLSREVESEHFPYCIDQRIGVIPYSPLFRGLLTGKYSPNHVFEDTRSKNTLFVGKAFKHILDTLNELQPIADRYGLNMAQLAIRWVLTHPAVTSAIVGIKSTDQICGILPAAEEVLDTADWYIIADALEKAKRTALQMSES